MTQVVPASQVVPARTQESSWHIRAMMRVLQKQGQIEPLQVRELHMGSNGPQEYMVFSEDAYGTDAARRLGWTTLLIVVQERYEA